MDKNFNQIPKNVLDKVEDLICDCGMSKEDFVKSLAYTYNINSEANNYFELLKGYDTYCDSFIA